MIFEIKGTCLSDHIIAILPSMNSEFVIPVTAFHAQGCILMLYRKNPSLKRLYKIIPWDMISYVLLLLHMEEQYIIDNYFRVFTMD